MKPASHALCHAEPPQDKRWEGLACGAQAAAALLALQTLEGRVARETASGPVDADSVPFATEEAGTTWYEADALTWRHLHCHLVSVVYAINFKGYDDEDEDAEPLGARLRRTLILPFGTLPGASVCPAVARSALLGLRRCMREAFVFEAQAAPRPVKRARSDLEPNDK